MGNIDMKVRKKQTVKVHIKREKNTVTLIHSFQKFLYIKVLESKLGLKPSLFMNILSINNFTIKLLSKLLNDLSIGVHLKSSL